MLVGQLRDGGERGFPTCWGRDGGEHIMTAGWARAGPLKGKTRVGLKLGGRAEGVKAVLTINLIPTHTSQGLAYPAALPLHHRVLPFLSHSYFADRNLALQSIRLLQRAASLGIIPVLRI